MASQAQSAQELDELTLCESGWPVFQHPWQILENSSSNQIHLSNFLAPETTCFETFPLFETSNPPPATTHDTLEPFQCVDQNLPLHFGDPHLHRLSYGSGCNTVVPRPAPGRFCGSGSAVNDSHSTPDRPSVSSPLQRTFTTIQGSHDIADIGASICSLVAEQLKRMSGLSITQASTLATTTPLPAGNDPLWPPDIRTSGRILVDSKGHKLSHRARKTQKKENSGLVKQEKGRSTR